MQPLVNIPRLNEEEDWRRTSIFQTRVACQGRLCTLIIDGGSCSNLASEELVEKLNLKTEDHPNPYQIAWVNDASILVSSRCLVTFNFSNNFELSAWCDVLPMKVAHIMLGRPWLFDERVQHDGYENTYTLVRNGRKKILRPMKEIPPHKQPEEKVAPLKLEEPSNILIKKQVEVTRKDEEIINDESRKQEVMKLILDQPIEELKEVEEVSEESMFDFPRPNIIVSGGKHEESAEISFEYREFKNLILPQNNLQEECGKQLPTSLLKTHNYFKNYQLVVQHQKVFQTPVFVLHEIEKVQEILRSCLTMGKRRRRKKGWKALLGISIDRGKSLKLKVEFFSSQGELMRMNLQDIYQERELVLIVIKVGLLLLGIKLGLIFVGV